MRGALFVVLALAGCAAHQPSAPASPDRVPIVVINENGGCGSGAAAPAPPRIPRTSQQVSAWAARLVAALSETARDLEACDRKLTAVLHDVQRFNAAQLRRAR